MTGLTINDPATFSEVIASEKVIPGDIIEMRGGTYTGDWQVSVGGTSLKPVTFKPYNNEQVIISGGLNITKQYTEWQNLTIQQPDANKLPVYMTAPGTRLIDCDISGGFIGVSWFGYGVGALLRCNIHNTSSYGIYTHNGGGLREITDCTFADIGGYYAMHLYSTGANPVHDYLVSGCEIDKPVMVHSSEVSNVTFTNNLFHSRLVLGNTRTTEDVRQASVRNNTFDGIDLGLHIIDFSDVEVTGNDFAITEYLSSQANISLQRNVNEQSTVIDGNHYVGGWFVLEDVYNVSFANWQAAGYDANGTYTPA